MPTTLELGLSRIGEIHGNLEIIGLFSRYDRSNRYYVTCTCRPKVKQVMYYTAIKRQGMCDTCYDRRHELVRETVNHVPVKPKHKNKPPNTRYDKKRYHAYQLEHVIDYLIDVYIERAKEKGRVYDLTREEFIYLVTQPCHYCGIAPDRVKPYSNGEFWHLGIDRVHNKHGYFFLNCVSCCWDCNMLKGSKDYQAFLDGIMRIARYKLQIQ